MIRLLNFLTNIIDLELGIFETDGWIIENGDSTYKLKPIKHLTIDLIYKENKWMDYERNIYPINMYFNPILGIQYIKIRSLK